MTYDNLAELGMDAGFNPGVSQASDTNDHLSASDTVEEPKDYFVEKDGQKFAGTHLLVELWDATNLDDPKVVEGILLDAARKAGATILHSHMHHFTPFSGVSGVVVLAESHISIHTWPEKSFAAIDVFMCGECDPNDSVPVLEAGFKPGSIEVSEHRRGLVKP